MPFFRPPLHPRSALPPPRRVGPSRVGPSPVGHGRGLASRPGCAVPGEGVGSPCLRLASLGALRSKLTPLEPPPLRLRPASPTPGERGRRSSCQPIGSQPLLACARDSLCLPGKVPHRLRRGRCAPKLSCRILRRQPLAVVLRFARTRALLWPLPALTLATGQVFTADHASFFAGNCHCQGKQPPPDIRPSLRSDVDLLCPLAALPLATGQAFTIAFR